MKTFLVYFCTISKIFCISCMSVSLSLSPYISSNWSFLGVNFWELWSCSDNMSRIFISNMSNMSRMSNTSRSNMSRIFISLCGPVSILPSSLLSSGPYGTMYSVIILCNTCTSYSFFVWLMIFSNPGLRWTTCSI